jgi:DNA-binding NtrC family response regulator
MHEAKAKLLIVDDEPSIRMSLSLILTEIGYRVRSVEDGVSALIAIREEVPEILLSDLNMPGMSGFELLSEVRRNFPDVQTIAMSGAFSGDEVPSGVLADAFYQKGSSVISLLKMIENLPWHERIAFRPVAGLEPMWGESGIHDAIAPAYLTTSCPERLGTFSQPLH